MASRASRLDGLQDVIKRARQLSPGDIERLRSQNARYGLSLPVIVHQRLSLTPPAPLFGAVALASRRPAPHADCCGVAALLSQLRLQAPREAEHRLASF